MEKDPNTEVNADNQINLMRILRRTTTGLLIMQPWSNLILSPSSLQRSRAARCIVVFVVNMLIVLVLGVSLYLNSQNGGDQGSMLCSLWIILSILFFHTFLLEPLRTVFVQIIAQ